MYTHLNTSVLKQPWKLQKNLGSWSSEMKKTCVYLPSSWVILWPYFVYCAITGLPQFLHIWDFPRNTINSLWCCLAQILGHEPKGESATSHALWDAEKKNYRLHVRHSHTSARKLNCGLFFLQRKVWIRPYSQGKIWGGATFNECTHECTLQMPLFIISFWNWKKKQTKSKW